MVNRSYVTMPVRAWFKRGDLHLGRKADDPAEPFADRPDARGWGHRPSEPRAHAPWSQRWCSQGLDLASLLAKLLA